MTNAVLHIFANVTAKLEDLHAIAVEGQWSGNAPDMQSVLIIHLRDGLAALDNTVRAMTAALQNRIS